MRPDKRHGAFCATTIPGVHPYVLTNYTGDRRSILTLAHELGHGLHGALSQPLGLYNASTPLTTAETASVFGEALTFKRLLASEDDPRRRLDLLAGRIEDAIATVFRQIAMNRFEHAVHTERREAGEIAPRAVRRALARAASRAVRRLGRHRRLHTVVELHPALHGCPRLRLRVRVRLPVLTRDLSAGTSRRATRWSSRTSTCCGRVAREPPEELAALVGLDLSDPAIWAAGIEALAVDLDEAESLAASIGLDT